MKKRIMLPIVGALVIVSVGTAKTIVSDELTALLPKTVAEPITLQLAVEEYQKDNSFVEFLDTYCSDNDFVIGYPDEVGGEDFHLKMKQVRLLNHWLENFWMMMTTLSIEMTKQ